MCSLETGYSVFTDHAEGVDKLMPRNLCLHLHGGKTRREFKSRPNGGGKKKERTLKLQRLIYSLRGALSLITTSLSKLPCFHCQLCCVIYCCINVIISIQPAVAALSFHCMHNICILTKKMNMQLLVPLNCMTYCNNHPACPLFVNLEAFRAHAQGVALMEELISNMTEKGRL